MEEEYSEEEEVKGVEFKEREWQEERGREVMVWRRKRSGGQRGESAEQVEKEN